MNFLGMGPMELLLIVVLALIVFGPARLPEIMAQVGKAIGDFRRATSELSDEFNRTIQAELQETRAVVDETKATFLDARTSIYDAHASVNSAITGLPAPVRTAAPGDAVPVPNGTSAEAYVQPSTNGTTAVHTPPPLADTSQWSWETSASPTAPTPSAEAASGTPSTSAAASSDQAGASATASPDSANPVPPPSSPATERAARDELLPPY